MGSAKNLHEVSAIFFFILAFAAVAAGLSLRNDWAAAEALLLLRVIDVPLAMIGLLYGGTTLYLQMNENQESASPWSIIISAACILLFGLAVFMNFAFPSRI